LRNGIQEIPDLKAENPTISFADFPNNSGENTLGDRRWTKKMKEAIW
jgi:hypothetical protein